MNKEKARRTKRKKQFRRKENTHRIDYHAYIGVISFFFPFYCLCHFQNKKRKTIKLENKIIDDHVHLPIKVQVR